MAPYRSFRNDTPTCCTLKLVSSSAWWATIREPTALLLSNG